MRPFAFVFHVLRRSFRQPYWRRDGTPARQDRPILMPLVSIIMNVRNGAAFLRDALNSVMAQTFQDWELIVWDDCSTDDSAKIVAEYRDPRIRYYLSPDDTPLGPARNAAIRKATGEWLAFLDQDDIWLPRKLEQQMALAGDGVGIIYGRTVMFDVRGNRRDYDYGHEFSPLPEGNIFTQLFSEACFIAMSSAVLRRSAVDEVGGIPDNIQVVPDYYLYIAIARRYRRERCSRWYAAIACTRAACRTPTSDVCMKSRSGSSISGRIVWTRELSPTGEKRTQQF